VFALHKSPLEFNNLFLKSFMENIVKYTKGILVILLMTVLFDGCATIRGNTLTEQREYVLDMMDETLVRLYNENPIAKEQIKKAAGYGVFSNINSNIFLLSTGSGYGVVTDNKSGKLTYMKMMTVGGGLGLGLKDYRAVIIFRKLEDMEKFIVKGWEFGGQADAALKSGDKGGAISLVQSVDLDIIIYQLTESGAALQVTLQGTKYWKHKDLNL